MVLDKITSSKETFFGQNCQSSWYPTDINTQADTEKRAKIPVSSQKRSIFSNQPDCLIKVNLQRAKKTTESVKEKIPKSQKAYEIETY